MTQINARQSKIGVKGQVTIPIEMRRALQLETEDKVSFELKEGEIIIRPTREEIPLEQLQGYFRKGKGKTKEEIDTFIREMRGPLEP